MSKANHTFSFGKNRYSQNTAGVSKSQRWPLEINKYINKLLEKEGGWGEEDPIYWLTHSMPVTIEAVLGPNPETRNTI